MTETAEAIVIGAGPAGLAAAKCLADIGIKPLVLEKDEAVGSTWRRHYERLHLHTPRDLSALPGLPIPREAGTFPTREAVIAYLDSYANTFNIAPRFGTEVKAIAREGQQWRVATRDGLFLAPLVVMATGWSSFPNRPRLEGEASFSGGILHSSAYRNPTPYTGKRVLLVGFGNSGAEIALDLAEHNVDVSLSLRSPANVLPRELFGISVLRYAIAQKFLPPRFADMLNAPLLRFAMGNLAAIGIAKPAKGALETIRDEGKIPVLDVGTCAMIRAGKIKVFPGITKLAGRNAHFVDGLSAPFDAIILATGFVPDWRSIFTSEPALFDAQGLPRASDGPPAAPGLYFLGARPVATGELREIALGARRIASDYARGR